MLQNFLGLKMLLVNFLFTQTHTFWTNAERLGWANCDVCHTSDISLVVSTQRKSHGYGHCDKYQQFWSGCCLYLG